MERRRLSLTTRGAFALGVTPTSAVAGLALGAEELVLLSLALVALLAAGVLQCSLRASRAHGSWRMAIELDGTDAGVGRDLPMVVTLAASGRGGAVPTWLEDPRPCWRRLGRGATSMSVARGDAPSSGTRRPLPNPASALPLPRLDGDGTAALAFLAPTMHRGVFGLPGLRLWCFDSVGLFARVVALGPSATVIVHPVPTDAAVTEEALRGEPGPEDERPRVNSASRPDNFGDFAGLRAYVPGDRLRLLYWPALARTGDLVVRAFEDTTPHRVYLVADVRPELGDDAAEEVLAAAAGIGLRALAGGATVELSTSAGQRVGIQPGPNAQTALLRAMATVESGAPPDLGRSRGRRRGRRGAHDRGTSGDAPDIAAAAHLVPGALAFAPYGHASIVVTTQRGASSLPRPPASHLVVTR